ncbi:MAG: GDSL-type esterase/lipase family protein [Treponemataceae bacterium]|nr:GDSL-type esterase/lipase family protein [Treponemataceae bacterium]
MTLSFDFTDNLSLPEIIFSQERGYGFVTETNRAAVPALQIPELNTGFDSAPWFREIPATRIELTENGAKAVSDFEGDFPLCFKCPLPFEKPRTEGNILVTVRLFAEKDASEVLIFLGRRRLAWKGALKAGETFSGTFALNCSPIIPRGTTAEEACTSADIAVTGGKNGVCLQRIIVEPAPETVKTVWIAGDSTVTDQSAEYPYTPGASYCGWGQMLSAFLKKDFAVSNHAHSGLTTESFKSEGHYAIMLPRVKAGDIVLFQFAHNDQKLAHLKAKEGYRNNLINYINDIREKNAVPVLVTPLARNTWKGDFYNDLLAEYAEVVLELGKDMNVPVVDLHKFAMDFVTDRGVDGAKPYFFPSDYTHSNDFGAFHFAHYVSHQLDISVCPMANDILPPVATKPLWVAPHVIELPKAPAGLETQVPPKQVIFDGLERPDDKLTRSEALEFVIRAMKFFPTNVYNDVFTDIAGHETYAGAVECAYQNGIIPVRDVEAKLFRPEEPVSAADFLEFVENGYKSRKSDKLDTKDFLLKTGNAAITRRIAADFLESVKI